MALPKSTLQRLVTKFETTRSVNNQPTPLLQRNARLAENIAAVRESCSGDSEAVDFSPCTRTRPHFDNKVLSFAYDNRIKAKVAEIAHLYILESNFFYILLFLTGEV
ncbi:hypothetical protein RR48_12152 [Papilio machaon]|uniref:Uncharacterized protein n=1 Tax=Papilio machaon TaxID=76193 RepID=A0A194QSV2_PAPMA|nr:hypothetical protein RR48_12152 [Papilio machaon]